MPSIQRPYTLFDTEQVVYSRASAQPWVGFEYINDLPEGWLFDIKRWCSLFDLRLPSLPRLTDPSTQGLPEWDYFKSGVGSDKIDLEVTHLKEESIDHERLWIPQVKHGWYYRWKTDYFFYGDNSRVQYVDSTDNEDGRNVVILASAPEPGFPILASSFRRTTFYQTPVYDTRVQQAQPFTGVYQDEEQLSTATPVTREVVWANVDTTKREFVVDRRIPDTIRLLFNRDYIESVGTTPTQLQDFGTGDILGASDGSEWQTFRLERFPVVPDTFRLYVVDASASTWEEGVRVDTYNDLLDLADAIYPYGGFYYYLDKDLGRVLFGDAETGVPTKGHYVVAMYDVTLRIEYEEADLSTKIEAWNADVNPVTQSVNQGFVCITHEELDPASITLKIHKDLISGLDTEIYGPIYVGNDYATLRAEVLSPTGTPVPSVEIQFDLVPDTVGFLGGSSTGTAYGVTDGSGYSYSFYQPPVDSEDMGFYATGEDAVQGNVLHLNNPEAGLSLDDDVYLYKILKDDPLLGMVYDEYLEGNLPDPPWWANPSTYPTNYESWRDQIIQMHNLAEWTTTPEPNGRKVIVYNWDAVAINPILGTAGAFVPTRPLSVNAAGGELTYPAGALLEADAEYNVAIPPYYHDIGAYWVVCTKYVQFQASCFSSYYNKRIYSDIITARVQLPRYLLGEYVNEQLYKIPFGWKIYQDAERNHAAGLDGATFLTINPHSGPYEIIDLVIDTDGDGTPDFFEPYYQYQDQSMTGEWASAPWSGISFKFSVS
jgi:hypothetical protein